jgi:hypothetical protein
LAQGQEKPAVGKKYLVEEHQLFLLSTVMKCGECCHVRGCSIREFFFATVITILP